MSRSKKSTPQQATPKTVRRTNPSGCGRPISANSKFRKLASEPWFKLALESETVSAIHKRLESHGYVYETVRAAAALVRETNPTMAAPSVMPPEFTGEPDDAPAGEAEEKISDEDENEAEPIDPAATRASFDVKGNSAVGRSISADIRTIEDFVTYLEVDTTIWRVKDWRAKKWDGYIKNKSKEIETRPLFALDAKFERLVAIDDARSEIALMVEEAKAAMPFYQPVVRPARTTPGHLLEISIFDPHFGKLAWNPETRHGSYDVNIAERVFFAALEDLLNKASGCSISQVLLPLGNDLLNTDNLEGKTTAGTPQSTDGRQIRTFTRVRQTMVAAIERARQIAPVHVKMVPGNHDRLSVFHLGEALEMRFHNCDDVVIDNTPPNRKYYEWGRNMLLFTHGDKPKPAELHSVAAAEEPQMWGRTRFREAHIGHMHKTALDEKHGFRVRTIAALCPADGWHSENGYIGNVRSAEAFLYSRDNGMEGSFVHNVPEEE
jgi:hypothetical protein